MPTTTTSIMALPQPINYLPQTSNVSPAPLPLRLLTNGALPFTIDQLAYISDVYDCLFASQVAGTTPLIKNIRTILLKKLLMDHATQELIFRPILNFEDLISFTLDILRQTALLS